MISKMTKYSFVLLSGETGAFLEKLQELGVMDITRSTKPVDAASAAMLEKATEIKKIMSMLKSKDFSKDKDAEAIMAAAAKAVVPEDVVKGTLETEARIERLKSQLHAAVKETGYRKPWGDFSKESLQRLTDNGYVIRYYITSRKKFNEEWSSLYPLQIINEEDSKLWFVTITGKDEEYSFPIEEAAAPAGDWKEADAECSRLAQEIIGAEGLLVRMKDSIPALQKAYEKELSDLDLYLADASKSLAAEDKITVFEGFAPTENDEALQAEFGKLDVAYVKESATEEDNPPIRLKNNKFVKMFEVLTGMYGMPVYSEFDPTAILGPFFLLFFAMCMGDAGYGILLFIIGFILKKMKGSSMAKLGPLVSTLGVGTFFVGIILGTFFGISLADCAWVPDWLKSCMITGKIPGTGYDKAMALAVGVGIFHICLAMTMKAIVYTKRFGFKKTISTWAWLILIIGGICIAGLAFIGVMDKTVTKWAVIVLAVISGLGIYIFNDLHRTPLVNIGAGLWDTDNMVTGLLGDVLSYIRLYALGLAGGMLGGVFNDLAMQLYNIDVPGVNILGFLLIAVFGHVLNLAMSCLGAFVHPLRLSFVEYFKNSGYEGKGKLYNPLTLNKEQ